MEPSYRRQWAAILAGTVTLLWWSFWGRALVRRLFYAPPAFTLQSQTQTRFIALAFPAVTPEPEPFTLGLEDFEGILDGLAERGYAPIGFEDIRGLYLKGRKLPPKAVLLALDRDDPDSVRLADGALKARRLRAALFLRPAEAAGAGGIGWARGRRRRRRRLSDHAISQLAKTGSWDIGYAVGAPDQPPSEFRLAPEGSGDPFRFLSSRAGYNDERRGPGELRLLRVPPRPAAETLAKVDHAQPRSEGIEDRFAEERLGPQWIAEWGVASSAHRRLALLPTPRQTSASVLLAGTEGWRDVVLEFELSRFEKSFWAYARHGAGRYIRVGAQGKDWVLQQKAGTLPATLARSPIPPGALPARLRLVLKGDAALVYVNDRLLFPRAVPLDPAVDRGSVQFGVFDPQLKAARATLNFVRARPLEPRWISVSEGPLPLDKLRSEAAEARVLSPLWLRVERGRLREAGAGAEPELLWALAGFYGCRLIPMVDLEGGGLAGGSGRALGAAGGFPEALVNELSEAAARLEAPGLNLRWSGPPPEGAVKGELARLRERLAASRRELWITVLGEPGPGWAGAADGLLRGEEAAGPGSGLERLVAVLSPQGAAWY